MFSRRILPLAFCALLTALAATLCIAAPLSETIPAAQPDPSTFLETLDPAERAWLRQHPVVRVGGPLAFEPFHFHGEDGKAQGMAFDHLRLVLGMLGLKMQPQGPLPWPQVLDKAKAREIDLIACAARSPEREAYLLFSDPVLSFPLVIVGRNDGPFVSGLQDLRGLRVTFVRGNVIREWLRRDGIDCIEIEAATPREAMEAVSRGDADFHIENLAAAAYLIDRYGLANLKIAAPTTYRNYDLHFAVRSDWPELVSIIDKAIGSITREQAEEIRHGWLSVRFEHGIRPGDVVRWVLLAGAPLVAILIALLIGHRRLQREIVQRRRTEDALRHERDLNLRYLDTVQTMIVALDTEGRIIMINRAGREMLGYTETELLGRQWFATCLPQPEGMELVYPRFREILVGRSEASTVFENPIMRRDGTQRMIGWRNTYLKDAGGRIVGALSSGEDITERKEAESRMAATLEALKTAKAAAEAANVAKSEFLANMSHEIRTPINGVMGMLQVLQGSPLNPEQAGFTATAITSCRRLMRLLGDILDLSRIEAGKLAVRTVPMSISEVFGQTRDIFRSVALECGTELRFETDPRIPHSVLGDAVRLQQVLMNLVGNALKFTSAGQVCAEAWALSPLRPGRCRVFFCVSDTGAGIPDDKLSLLFKPFSQAHEGYARTHQGAGLGLSICKRLVDLMGGNMSVISEPGVGTSIAFSLAFHVDEGRVRPEPARSAATGGALKGKRVLLAEDDPVSALAGRAMLEKQGIEVTHVQDGQRVLDALARDEFDLVLMDVQMPVMDGVEATRAIRAGRAGEKARGIPVVAMTAYAMTGDRDGFLQAGMNAYVAKPIGLDELLRVISDALKG